ncbi:MAG: carboxypeptidase-like regulatory domain-containing protein, partial [Planctomycetota bacterium]
GAVEVLVLDESSNPVGDAALFARRADGTLVDSLSWALTGQDGRATYSGLEPGRYTISARSERLASPLNGTQVDVQAGETLRIEQRVADATRLVVTTADAEGKKTRASYIVENADGLQVQRMQSLDELRRAVAGGGFALLEASFGPLPPGRYRVTATGPDGRTVTKPVKLSGQEERRMTLRLR